MPVRKRFGRTISWQAAVDAWRVRVSNIAEAENFMAWYFEGCRLIETAQAAYSGCAKTMTLTGARFASVVQHTN